MIYISSHGFEFGVDTENTHNGDWANAAAGEVKSALDAMGAARVSGIHADLKAGDLSDDYHEAINAGCLVNDYPDFVVTLTAY